MNAKWLQVNRSALLVRPRQPFVDWANRFLRAEGKPELELRGTSVSNPYGMVVLAPECDATDRAAAEHLRLIFPKIFEELLLLDEFTADRSLWPDTRDFRVFSDWFDVEIHTLVMDGTDYSLSAGDEL